MGKPRKTRADLVDMIRDQLRSDPECERLNIAVVRSMEPGSNWTIVVSHSNAPSLSSALAYRAAQFVRSEFDLED